MTSGGLVAFAEGYLSVKKTAGPSTSLIRKRIHFGRDDNSFTGVVGFPKAFYNGSPGSEGRWPMFDRYSTASRRAVFLARAEAGFVGSKQIDSEHLLLGLLRVDPSTFQQVAPALSLTSVRADAVRWSAPGEKLPTSVDLPISDDGKLAFAQAVALADLHKAAFVRTEHLTLALLSISSSHAAVILEEARATLAGLEKIVAEIQDRSNQEGAPFSREDLQFLMGY